MNGHRQRGMAIISALLIVTVVAVIAAGLIARQSAFIRALESEQLRIQAGWMLRGGLEWSRQLLLEDSRRDPLTRLDQRWAQPMRGLRLSSAELPFNGQLEDEQASSTCATCWSTSAPISRSERTSNASPVCSACARRRLG